MKKDFTWLPKKEFNRRAENLRRKVNRVGYDTDVAKLTENVSDLVFTIVGSVGIQPDEERKRRFEKVDYMINRINSFLKKIA